MSAILPRALAVVVAGLSAAAATHLALITTQLTPSTAFAQGSPTASAPADAVGPLRPVERTFVVEATQGGRSAAELSRLAVSHAAASNLRDFAQQLTTDYAQINNALETLARRKAVMLPLEPTSYSDEYRQLATQSGGKFDAACIRAFARISQRELRVCEAAVADAKDPDVRDLAGSILPVLRDHVNKATELEKSL